MRSSSGRAVELLLVLSVLGVLLLLSLHSAAAQVQGALERAERSQASLDAAALGHARAVNALLGEQAVTAQVAGGLPETPAVRAGRAFVAATDVRLPVREGGAVAGLAALVLLTRSFVRVRARRRRGAALRRSAVALSAFSPAAARCGAVDDRGTVLLPAR